MNLCKNGAGCGILYVSMIVFCLVFFGAVFLSFGLFHCLSRHEKKMIQKVDEENHKIMKKFISNSTEVFNKRILEKKQSLVGPINGFFSKDYCDFFADTYSRDPKRRMPFSYVTIMPDKDMLTEEEAEDCGEIIRIEFNGDFLLGCMNKEEVPNYVFSIVIKDMDGKDCEIFVLNTVHRLMEKTSKNFIYSIKEFSQRGPQGQELNSAKKV